MELHRKDPVLRDGDCLEPAGSASIGSDCELRVLIVDDEPLVRDALVHLLGQRRFVGDVADNLQTALRAVMSNPPDVILLDIKLGSEDGLDLLGRLKSVGLSIPCVVLTAHAGPYDGYRAHELGVGGLIEKPASPADIATELRRVVAADRADSGATSVASVQVFSSNHFVAATTRLILKTFRTKGLSLRSLASSACVSPGHLSWKFRREMGCSVIAYIHRCRVEHACHLLRATTLSVKAIADECGYHGAAELHRHFVQARGMSPSAFRSLASREPF